MTEALHVYRLNAAVDVRNRHMLTNLPASCARYEMKAKDAATGQTKQIDLASLSTKRLVAFTEYLILLLVLG